MFHATFRLKQLTLSLVCMYLKQCPWKAVEKTISIQKINFFLAHRRNESVCILRILRMNMYCTYIENTRIEAVRTLLRIRRMKSVHILRICGMNLYVYWEYAEWDESSNGSLLCEFPEYSEWNCTYTDNTVEWICSYTDSTQNESLCILRICGMQEKSNI